MASDELVLLATVALALTAAGWLAARLRLPPALGYLLVGLAAPRDWTQAILGDLVSVEGVAHIGVLVLLFYIGLELDLKTLRRVLGETRVVALLDILVPVLLVAGLARFIGWSVTQAVVLGFALTLSSTIFGERLSAMPGFPNGARTRMFGVLLGEDVAAGILLAVLPLMGGTSAGGDWFAPLQSAGILVVGLVVLAALALVVVPRLLERLTRTHQAELIVLGGFGVLAAFAAAAAVTGAAELGAFLAGMAAAESGSRYVVRNNLLPFKHASLAIFFFAAGLVVDPAQVLAHLPFAVLVALAVFAAKMLVHVPSSLVAGLGLDASLRTGIGLATVGEFSLILLAAAVPLGLVDPTAGAIVIGAMVLLLVASPLLMLLTPHLVGAVAELPPGTRAALQRNVAVARRFLDRGAERAPGRGLVKLVAQLLLVVVIAFAALAAERWALETIRAPAFAIEVTIFVVAAVLIVAVLAGAYATYRRIIRGLVGVGPSPTQVDRMKLHLADAIAVMVTVAVLTPVVFLANRSVPVALVGLGAAAVLALLTWRQARRITSTLEDSLAQVLGDERPDNPTIDDAMRRYAWDLQVSAVGVPANSMLAGRALGPSRLTDLTGVTVLEVQRGKVQEPSPGDGFVVKPGDTLVLAGTRDQLARAEALVAASEEPLRLIANSQAARVEMCEVKAGAAVEGALIGIDGLPGTRMRVLGYWPAGDERPRQLKGHVPLRAGDRIIAYMTPTQAEQVQALVAMPRVAGRSDGRADALARA